MFLLRPGHGFIAVEKVKGISVLVDTVIDSLQDICEKRGLIHDAPLTFIDHEPNGTIIDSLFLQHVSAVHFFYFLNDVLTAFLTHPWFGV